MLLVIDFILQGDCDYSGKEGKQIPLAQLLVLLCCCGLGYTAHIGT